VKKTSWFLICEWDFAVLGSVMAWGGAPPYVTIWMMFMCLWMMKKVFEDKKRRSSH